MHYLGSGTSGRLAVLDAVELRPTFDVPPGWFVPHLAGGEAAMTRAIEGAEDDVEDGERVARETVRAGDLVVGVAASGRTPWVLAGLRVAREAGAATALVCADPAATAEVDVLVGIATGPEVLTGSTRMKAGTAQKLVLNAVSTAVMVRMGRTWSNLMVALVATNDKLRERSVRILVEATGADSGRVPRRARRRRRRAAGWRWSRCCRGPGRTRPPPPWRAATATWRSRWRRCGSS